MLLEHCFSIYNRSIVIPHQIWGPVLKIIWLAYLRNVVYYDKLRLGVERCQYIIHGSILFTIDALTYLNLNHRDLPSNHEWSYSKSTIKRILPFDGQQSSRLSRIRCFPTLYIMWSVLCQIVLSTLCFNYHKKILHFTPSAWLNEIWKLFYDCFWNSV